MQELSTMETPPPFKTTALVHPYREAERSDIAGMSDNFSTVKTSLEDTEKLTQLFQDVDCLVLLPPAEEKKKEHSLNVIASVNKEVLKAVILLSSELAGEDKPTLMEFQELEEAVKGMGVDCCIIR